jgi:hypothetical protein
VIEATEFLSIQQKKVWMKFDGIFHLRHNKGHVGEKVLGVLIYGSMPKIDANFFLPFLGRILFGPLPGQFDLCST